MLPILNNRITNNTLLAVSIEDAAKQCRLTSDDLNDTDILANLKSSIISAQAYLEANFSIVFGSNDYLGIWELSNNKILHFSNSNVTEIKSVTLLENTLNHTLYTSNTHSFIELSTSVSGKVKVEYIAGFKDIEEIPTNVKQSVLMLTSYYFDNRSASTDKTLTPSLFSVEALMLPYKKLF